MTVLLFLASVPTDAARLALAREARIIRARIAATGSGLRVREGWAVRAEELQQHLLEYRPSMVHFSGHGTTSGDLIAENSRGLAATIPADALAELFDLLPIQIQCVVLNACFSEAQARAIAKNVACVVGMRGAITDTAAITFSEAFYQAVGYGLKPSDAFELGCNQLALLRSGESDIPQIFQPSKGPRTIITSEGSDGAMSASSPSRGLCDAIRSGRLIPVIGSHIRDLIGDDYRGQIADSDATPYRDVSHAQPTAGRSSSETHAIISELVDVAALCLARLIWKIAGGLVIAPTMEKAMLANCRPISYREIDSNRIDELLAMVSPQTERTFLSIETLASSSELARRAIGTILAVRPVLLLGIHWDLSIEYEWLFSALAMSSVCHFALVPDRQLDVVRARCAGLPIEIVAQPGHTRALFMTFDRFAQSVIAMVGEVLFVRDGTDEPLFHLRDGNLATIGRDEAADIVLASDTKASRRHALVTLADGECVVTDLNSRNGTFVNGALVTMARLRHGDRLLIGESRMIFVEPGRTSTARGAER